MRLRYGWLIANTVLMMATCVCLAGCFGAPYSSMSSSSGSGATRTGTFTETREGSATLDLSFVGSIQGYRPGESVPIGLTYVWNTTFQDFQERAYDVTVVLRTKAYVNGWYRQSCPIWELRVNGHSVAKDTQGHGHWHWTNELSVSGVTLNVYTERGHRLGARVYLGGS